MVFVDDIILKLIIGDSGNNSSWSQPPPPATVRTNYNDWNNYLIQYHSDSLVFYLNGIHIFSNYAPNYTFKKAIILGDRNYGSSTSYKIGGNMDNLYIWTKTLTPTEITQCNSCTPTGNETDLLGFWDFEAGLGNTVFDQTSNGNNGSLLNGVLWDSSVPQNSYCIANPIETQPQDTTILEGQQAIFSLTDLYSTPTYQWQSDIGFGFKNISNAGQFSGTTTNYLTISNTIPTNNNSTYRCIINESLLCSDTTNIATLNITTIDNI